MAARSTGSAADWAKWLQARQLPDGGFPSHSAPQGEPFGRDPSYRTTFFPALILAAISRTPPDSALQHVRSKLAAFLQKQRNRSGSYNYWARDSREATERPYPDDLDDTFCAAGALFEHDARLVTGTDVANLLAVLTMVEAKEGGPYRTWLVSADADPHWRDVDLAVNANVAYFLRLHDVELPNLTALFEDAITAGRYASPYYPNELPLLYFLARAYRGPRQPRLVEHLLGCRRTDGTWGNIHDTALMVTAAVRLGVPSGELTPAIRSLRAADPAAVAHPHSFCLDPAIDGRPAVAGCEAWSIALHLEALTAAGPVSAGVPRPGITSAVAERYHRKILDTVLKQCAAAGLEEPARRFCDRLLEGDPGRQITLLPYRLARSLGPAARPVPSAFLAQLGTASLYGWVAYSIFDDFLDEEGSPALTPLGVFALRQLTATFETILPAQTGFRPAARQALDAMDAANQWEVTHCRLPAAGQTDRVPTIPDYRELPSLATRSLGHLLAPLAVLVKAGYPVRSKAATSLRQFFMHYLTARQLADDVRDWQDDLARGQVNAVGALVLRRWRDDHPDARALPAAESLAQLFWQDVADDVSLRIATELKMARAVLADFTALADPAYLASLLDPIERNLAAARQERSRVETFLESYQPPSIAP